MMRSVQPATLRVAPGSIFQPAYYAHGKYAHGIERRGDKYLAKRCNLTIYGLEPMEQECVTPEEALAWCQSDYDSLTDTGSGGDTGPQPGPDPEPGMEPSLNNINPSSAKMGDPDLTMNVNGSKFTDTSIVYFNGGPLATTFNSASQLSVTVQPSQVFAPIDVQVWVQQGSYQTASKTFSFTS